MYKITILRSSPQSQTSFKDMLEPKKTKFGPKRAQNGQELNFSGLLTSIFESKTIRLVSIQKISKIQ